MGYHIAPVWEVLYKWICFVHKWYIALLLGDIETGDIASMWELAKSRKSPPCMFFCKINTPVGQFYTNTQYFQLILPVKWI